VDAGLERGKEFRRGQREDVTFALERLLVRVHRVGHVDGKDQLHVDVIGIGPLRPPLGRRRRENRRVGRARRERRQQPAKGEHR
jgi:hypothetical protein